MTLKELYELGIVRLEYAGIDESSLDAWYLLEYITGVSRAMYFADSGRPVDEEEKETYLRMIEKRAGHIPLQHLTGVQEFMGLEFQVNESVLIPRQDTEILVETALEKLETTVRYSMLQKDVPQAEFRVLDMCTGSGCILLSILYYIRKDTCMHPSGQRVSVSGIGADISGEALHVARQNAEQLQIEADFVESNLFSEMDGVYDLIVSNPPYIRTAVIEKLQEEVKNHDPVLALDGKEDGLYFYRKIVECSGAYLTEGGYLIFEIGYDQAKDVSELMTASGFRDVTVKKDLAGLDRVVFGVYDTKR